MKERLQNDILLIIISVISFFLIKKAINEFSLASLNNVWPWEAPMELFVSNENTGGEEKISWNKSRKLTWDDIKGKPDQTSAVGSITYCSIGYTATVKKDSMNVNVVCYFNREKSWVKDDQKTDDLLKHEQGHFDINEIYARKMRKIISGYKFDRNTLKRDIQIIYERCWRECSNFQQEYDNATESSKNVQKQHEWDKKITSDLKSMEEFSTSSVMASVF